MRRIDKLKRVIETHDFSAHNNIEVHNKENTEKNVESLEKHTALQTKYLIFLRKMFEYYRISM